MIAFKFGDNIDTDVIVPGQYLVLTDPRDLARVCMTGIRPDFPETAKDGGCIVAGRNFGSGSSREHAPVSIRGLGINCVIAKSFARIFFRNAINVGLPVLESPQAAGEIREGDEIRIDYEGGLIENLTKGECYRFSPFSESVQKIIRAGGLSGYIKEQLKKTNRREKE